MDLSNLCSWMSLPSLYCKGAVASSENSKGWLTSGEPNLCGDEWNVRALTDLAQGASLRV